MPGMICSVASCKSNSSKARQTGEKVTFFTFPKNEEIRKEWIKRCKRKDDFNPANKRICSKHFLPEDFEDRIKASIMNVKPKKLKERAIPSLHLEEDETQPRKISRPTQTNNRHKNKCNKDRLNGDFEIIYITGTPEDEESDYEVLQRKYNDLLEENRHLKKLLEKYLTEEREKISVRKKRVVKSTATNGIDLKKRKVVKRFDMKHISDLHSYNNKS